MVLKVFGKDLIVVQYIIWLLVQPNWLGINLFVILDMNKVGYFGKPIYYIELENLLYYLILKSENYI